MNTTPGVRDARSVLNRLIESGPRLRLMSVHDRARALAGAALPWADSRSPARAGIRADLIRVTGFSGSVVDRGLDAMFREIKEEALKAWWKSAGTRADSSRPLDRPRLAVIISAGNIPGVAVFPLAGCLLAGTPVVVKPASAEPVLVKAWQASFAETAPPLADSSAVIPWKGGDSELECVILDRADRIITYGHDETIRRLQSRFPDRVSGFGTGVSFAVIDGLSVDPEEAAAGLALDVARWDQQGCLSPHGAYVRGGLAEVEAFGSVLARALARTEEELPRGRLSPAEALQIRTHRAEAEARLVAGDAVRMWTSGEGLQWTVTATADPGFEVSCLNRTVWLRPVAAYENLPGILAPWRHLLQAAGLAVGNDHERVERLLNGAGVRHVVRLGTLQSPPVGWRSKDRDVLEILLSPEGKRRE